MAEKQPIPPKRGGQIALSGFSNQLQAAMQQAAIDWRIANGGLESEKPNLSAWLRAVVVAELHQSGHWPPKQ